MGFSPMYVRQWFFYVQKTAGIPAVGGKSFFPAPWCRNFFEKKQFLKISRKTEDSMKLLSSETVRMMKIIKSYFSLKKNNKTNEFDIYQIRLTYIVYNIQNKLQYIEF